MRDRKFIKSFNSLLTAIYTNVEKIESAALKKHGEGNLSIAEFHILEVVADGTAEGKTVGEIAQKLGVTFPTVTVACGRLEKKGCIERRRSEDDGRVVRITLTAQGRRMNAMHRYFHERMVVEMCGDADEGEIEALTAALNRLNAFLLRYADKED